MHGLRTIYKLNRDADEAARILASDHSEAERRSKEQFDADAKEAQERLQKQR